MKAIFHTKNCSFELEADTQTALFGKIVDLQNSGMLENRCGCCKNDNIYMQVRNQKFKDNKGKDKTATFYEWRCSDCFASLTMHLNNEDSGKKGNMYKVPYIEKDGEKIKDTNGWVKYVKKDQQKNKDNSDPVEW